MFTNQLPTEKITADQFHKDFPESVPEFLCHEHPPSQTQRTKQTILNAKNFSLETYFYLDILLKHKLYLHPMALTPSPLNYRQPGSCASEE